MLNVLIINNSQMTFLLRHFIIILQTKLIISCEETNINSNNKGSLRITQNMIEQLYKRHYKISYVYYAGVVVLSESFRCRDLSDPFD